MGRKPQSIVRYLCVFVDFEKATGHQDGGEENAGLGMS